MGKAFSPADHHRASRVSRLDLVFMGSSEHRSHVHQPKCEFNSELKGRGMPVGSGPSPRSSSSSSPEELAHPRNLILCFHGPNGRPVAVYPCDLPTTATVALPGPPDAFVLFLAPPVRIEPRLVTNKVSQWRVSAYITQSRSRNAGQTGGCQPAT